MHAVSISLLFLLDEISGELNQCADSEMPLSRAAGNAPERLCDLLRGEAEAKSPTLIRKSCAGSWVQQRALNLRAVSLRVLQHPGSVWRRICPLCKTSSISPHAGYACVWTCMNINAGCYLDVWCLYSSLVFILVRQCFYMCNWFVCVHNCM